MGQEHLNLGVAPNDGTGDKVRDAFGKIDAMFTEIYGEADVAYSGAIANIGAAGANQIGLVGQAGATAIASLSGLEGDRANRLIKAVTSAAGGAANVALLLTKDGAKTYKSGTATNEIDAITPLIGPANFAVQATKWNGTGGSAGQPQRAVLTSSGIGFSQQTSLTLASTAILAQTTRFALDMVVRLPVPLATFPSNAAANSAKGSYYAGDIVQVLPGVDPNTTIPTAFPGYADPVVQVLNSIVMDPGQLVCGYKIKRSSGDFAPLDYQMLTLAKSGTSAYLSVMVDPRGLIRVTGYDGTAAIECTSYNRPFYADGAAGPLQIKMEFDGTDALLYVNGDEMMVAHAVLNFVPDRIYLNGTPTSSDVANPVMGSSFTLDALCITSGLDYTKARAVSDAIAATFATPKQSWSPFANLWVHMDQSRTSAGGSGDTSGDANRPDSESNWNGMVSTNAAQSVWSDNPSQDFIPGIFAPISSVGGPAQIGPISPLGNVYGAVYSGTHTISGSNTETIEFGFARQLFQNEAARGAHLYMVGITIGSQSLAQLQAKSVPPKYLYDLSAYGPGGMGTLTYRESINRAIVEVVKRCHKRGQKVRVIAITNLQGETSSQNPSDLPIIGSLHEADFRQWFGDEISFLCDWSGPAPVMIKKAISYSYDGISNSFNTPDAGYTDNQFRLLQNDHDKVFRYGFLGGTAEWCGRFIHWTPTTRRRLAEIIGDYVRRTYFENGTSACLDVVAVARSGSNVLLTLNKPVDVVDQQIPTVLHRLQTGGFDTMGVVFEPDASSPSRTINGNVTVSTDGLTITVPISGGGALAGGLDHICITGRNAMWNNFRSREHRTGYYRDQNWPTSLPFSNPQPLFDPTGPLNDLTEWLAPSRNAIP